MSKSSVMTIGLGSLLLSSGQAVPASDLTIGTTIQATGVSNGKTYIYATPGGTVIGAEPSGNQGYIFGGPSTYWWQVSFNDNLTGWTYSTGITPVAAESATAPTLTFSANPTYIASGGSSTLSWSSTNATSCTGTGFSPSAASGSSAISPTATTTYTTTCTGSGGSTTRSAAMVVNPVPDFTWSRSLPITFTDPAIVPFGGTEMRFLLFMDGSLYAGIGDWEDPQLTNPQTLGAQVLRLDSANGSWVEDQNFIQAVTNKSGKHDYEAVAALGTAHFNHDSSNNPITPVDVLLAGFYNLNVSGLNVAQKTVTTGSVGPRGTWTTNVLVPPPSATGQVRSFASYTDSVTGVEMAFAGGDPYGIFSGAFYPGSNGIAWGATAEANSAAIVARGSSPGTVGGRVMSFAACGGKLYASIWDHVAVRTDGPNPSWQIFYQYSGPALPAGTSGFRGLTCVPNLNGSGSMLIASLEGPGDIYEFPLDGSQPTVELHMSNYLGTQLGTWISFSTAAYNNMVIDPYSGTTSCPDLLIGVGFIETSSYAKAYRRYYPTPLFLVRHCNGVYGIRAIVDPSITSAPPLMSTRSIAVSQFSGDPPGTIYAGGFEVDASVFPLLVHNTDWIYKGVPQ